MSNQQIKWTPTKAQSYDGVGIDPFMLQDEAGRWNTGKSLGWNLFKPNIIEEMKGKLTITVGISGSGKSTWSHEQWKKDPKNTTIINRDNIRALLFGFTEASVREYYKRPDIAGLEKKVTRYEDTLINDALNHGNHVIVDATHLNRRYLERFKYWNVPTEVETFNITITEAIKRDRNRTRQVGEDVIKRQLNQFKTLFRSLEGNPIDFKMTGIYNDPSKYPAMIFDIDGTIAHMDGRSPYEWKRVREDRIDPATVDILKDLHGSPYAPKIIICTGRDGSALFETKRWLADYKIPYDEIYIRPEGDMRPDWIVKEEMWREITEKNYIAGMFDDRLQVVRRARSLGFKVFNVEYHNF